MRRFRLVVLASLLLVVAVRPTLAAKSLLFTLTDPRGDDHGDGNLVYPTSGIPEPGELDLLSLTAEREDDGTLFEATFARPIRAPGRGPIDQLGTPMDTVLRYGFYTFNLDLYIDKDRQPGSGGVQMLPGRLAELAPEFAWDRAVCLTPRPAEAREHLSRILLRSLREDQKSDDPQIEESTAEQMRKQVPIDLESRVFFPVRVHVLGSRIRFFVPDGFLGGPPQPGWAYVVVVSGADVLPSLDVGSSLGLSDDNQNRLMILPISPGTWRGRFGGGRERDPLDPPLVDVIVPAGQSQERLLKDRDSRANRPAVLPGVVPGEAKKP